MTDLVTATDIGVPPSTSLVPVTNSTGSAGWEHMSVENLGRATSLFPLVTPPVLGTWVNQGGAVLTTASDGTLSLGGAEDATENVRGIFMALPATPWSYKIGFVPHFASVNYQQCGIALRESASGKLVLIGVYRDIGVSGGGSGPLFFIANYNSPTSKNANVSVPARIDNAGPFYLSVSDDGVTRKASFGFDRYVQNLVGYSVPYNSFIVPDQIGIYVDNTNTTNPLDITVFSWE